MELFKGRPTPLWKTSWFGCECIGFARNWHGSASWHSHRRRSIFRNPLVAKPYLVWRICRRRDSFGAFKAHSMSSAHVEYLLGPSSGSTFNSPFRTALVYWPSEPEEGGEKRGTRCTHNCWCVGVYGAAVGHRS